MKNAKFKSGDKVLRGDKELTVKVSQKNFSNGVIRYAFEETLEMVEEKELKPAGKTIPLSAEDKELQELHAQYEKALGKPVPVAKKNKADWIRKKVEEAGGGDPDPVKPAYDVLAALEREQLESLISEKEIDVDPGDYEDDDELLTAVCEVLEIEIPEAE